MNVLLIVMMAAGVLLGLNLRPSKGIIDELYQVGIKPQTCESHVLHRSDGWTVEKLDAQLKNAFRQSFTPLERSGDVLNWDPV